MTTSLPAGFPTLPTGVFNVVLGQDTAKNPGCIVDSSELNAWSCDSGPNPLQINITATGNDYNQIALLGSPQSLGNTFTYGTQIPIVASEQKLNLVTDNYDVSRGPAWFMQIPYDKLVILPEDSLDTPSTRKRSNNGPSPGDFQRKSTAQAGDQPWFCFWNGTLLETFIYPNQSASYNGGNSSQSPSSASTTTTASPSSSSTYHNKRGYTSSTSTSTASSASSTSSSSPDFLPFLPKVLKLEERRIPEGSLAVVPYCVQMKISSDGSATPVLNSTNQPVTIYINETEPTFASMSSKRSVLLYDSESLLMERGIEERQSATSCSCEWVATGD